MKGGCLVCVEGSYREGVGGEVGVGGREVCVRREVG